MSLNRVFLGHGLASTKDEKYTEEDSKEILVNSDHCPDLKIICDTDGGYLITKDKPSLNVFDMVEVVLLPAGIR